MTDNQFSIEQLHHALPEQQPPDDIVNNPPREKQQTFQKAPITADLLKAHITLMEKDILLAKQGDLFRLVQHHYRRLQAWHDQYTGWRIQRTSSLIRLVRHSSNATHGYLYERLKDPKDFACL